MKYKLTGERIEITQKWHNQTIAYEKTPQKLFKNGQAKGGLIAEILTVLFIGSEFWQLGFTQFFFMGTEYSKTLGCGGSRGY